MSWRAGPAPSLVVGLTIVVLSFVSAGCASTGGDAADATARPGLPPEAPRFDAATGLLRGIVTDDVLLPLQGVEVAIDDATTTTDANGSFVFEFVQPGAYVLRATKDSYLSTTSPVDVKAGEVTETAIQLSRVASRTTAFYTTLIQSGIDGCSIGWRLADEPSSGIGLNYSYPFCYALSLATELDRSILGWDIEPMARASGMWSETTFQSTQALGKSMRVSWTFALVEGVNPVIGVATDESPVRIRIDLGPVRDQINETGSVSCTDEHCRLDSWHAVGASPLGVPPLGAGVGFQQRFEEYATIFYNAPLPARFTVLPDS